MASPPAPASTAVPPVSLIDLLNNVPSPLIVVLTELGPQIACIRWAAEVISWRSSYVDSWLALGAWWAICLLSEPVLRYALPLLVLLVYTIRHYIVPSPAVPTTEHSFHTTVVNLSVTEPLVALDKVSLPALSWNVIFRLISILYIPYILLTYFIRLRTLLGIAGTLVLTWRAPWARTVRRVLWRSAWVRWSFSHAWWHLSGQPAPQLFSLQTQDHPEEPSKSLSFMFTVFENQRWWMGLDWTAALLPGERPSWCSASQQPLSPPSAFALPDPTFVYMGDGRGGMMKRTACWSWVEGEWKVVIKREHAGMKRLEKALPAGRETVQPSDSRIEKTLRYLKDAKEHVKDVKEQVKDKSGLPARRASATGNGSFEASVPTQEVDVSEQELHDEQEDPEGGESLTDVDGWVYGDNQWKAKSNQGGLGKYTRYRRWTRIALLCEVVEPASVEEVRDQNLRNRRQDVSVSSHQEPSVKDHKSPNTQEEPADSVDDGSSSLDERDGLRKRLKAAIRGPSSS